MRIAIPLQQGRFSQHFGGAETFAFYTVDAADRTIAERQLDAPPEHGRGIFPMWLRKKGATVVLAGGMGPRAIDIFAQHGIEVVLGVQGDDPDRWFGAISTAPSRPPARLPRPRLPRLRHTTTEATRSGRLPLASTPSKEDKMPKQGQRTEEGRRSRRRTGTRTGRRHGWRPRTRTGWRPNGWRWLLPLPQVRASGASQPRIALSPGAVSELWFGHGSRGIGPPPGDRESPRGQEHDDRDRRRTTRRSIPDRR